MDSDHNWIWKINLPNKIKILFWRCQRNALHVLDSPCKWGKDVINVCPVCNLTEESLIHILKECSCIMLLWVVSYLPNFVITVASSSLIFLIEQVCKTLFLATLKFLSLLEYMVTSQQNRTQELSKNLSNLSGDSSKDLKKHIPCFARDTHGTILAWKKCSTQFIPIAETTKVVATRSAVTFAYELDFTHVEFEGDCLNIVTQL